MKCPNCSKEMENKSYWYYGLGDWDMDYPATYHEEHLCADCDIKYVNGKWDIPNKFERATDKQIKCVRFICKELGINYEPLLKRKTWKFIHKYLEAAKISKRTSVECWCEENSDWLPEYF
jgi:hypothetical protein